MILIVKATSKAVSTITGIFLFGLSAILYPIKTLLFKFALLLYKVWRKYKRKTINIKNSTIWNSGLTIPVVLAVIAVSYFYPYIKLNMEKDYDFNNIISSIALKNNSDELQMAEFITEEIPQPTQTISAFEAPVIISDNNLYNENGIGGPDFPPTLITSSGAFLRPNISDDTSTYTSSNSRDVVEKYIVKEGDTISGIASKFNLKTQTILWANNLSKYSVIKPGNEIKIPKTDGVVYKIKSGETLSYIAKKYKTDLDKIKVANNLVSANQIKSGQTIIIPDARPIAPKVVKTASIRKIFTPKISNTPSAKGFIWPTTSRRITQYYSWRHTAIDVAGPPSITLVASKGGTVDYAGWSRGYGLNVVINHGNGVRTRYAHMRKIWVKRGQKVQQGEGLGKKGSTGWSTGPHIHFEIMINGKKVNPLSYLP